MIPMWLLFLLVGAAGGFTAGLFGVGGGLVIVPTLYFLWRGDPVLGHEVMHFAVATSLACIVVTSVTSSWTHWRARRLQFERLPWLAGAVSLGSVSAVLLANWLPSTWLKTAFGVFALMTCVSLLRKKSQEVRKPEPDRRELLGAGTFIGHVSTLLGVSGGAMGMGGAAGAVGQANGGDAGNGGFGGNGSAGAAGAAATSLTAAQNGGNGGAGGVAGAGGVGGSGGLTGISGANGASGIAGNGGAGGAGGAGKTLPAPFGAYTVAGGGALGFPIGFAIGAVHFKRSYRGETRVTFRTPNNV